MADVEVVIKIPEDTLKRTVFYREFRDLNDCIATVKALERAAPLPKGHGKLIDADWMLHKMATTDAQPRTQNEYYAWDFAKALFNEAPTIVEADTGSEV